MLVCDDVFEGAVYLKLVDVGGFLDGDDIILSDNGYDQGDCTAGSCRLNLQIKICIYIFVGQWQKN